jgi:predicted RNase H-like HicB family nuclease
MEQKTPADPVDSCRATPYIFRVTGEPDEDRYYAEAPALPGCHTWGHTYEEALQNIKEAVEVWIEVMREAGEPIPLEPPDAIPGARVTIGVLA